MSWTPRRPRLKLEPDRIPEHDLQANVIQWWSLAHRQWGIDERLLWACPNGGHRHVSVARKLKAEGVRPGIPDLTLAVARHGFHGLFIEMKARGGRVSPDQVAMADLLRRQGYNVIVAWSDAEAIKAIEGYLNPLDARK
jgi:hypothetical protein